MRSPKDMIASALSKAMEKINNLLNSNKERRRRKSRQEVCSNGYGRIGNEKKPDEKVGAGGGPHKGWHCLACLGWHSQHTQCSRSGAGCQLPVMAEDACAAAAEVTVSHPGLVRAPSRLEMAAKAMMQPPRRPTASPDQSSSEDEVEDAEDYKRGGYHPGGMLGDVAYGCWLAVSPAGVLPALLLLPYSGFTLACAAG